MQMSEQEQEKGRAYLPRAWGGGARAKKPRPSEDLVMPAPAAPVDPEVPEPHCEVSADDGSSGSEVLTTPGKTELAEKPVCPCHRQDEPVQMDLDGPAPDRQSESYGSGPVRVRTNIAGVRFGYACKIYHFESGDMELASGDWVMVKTEKGIGLGQVAIAPFERELDTGQLDGLRQVLRKAGRADFDQRGRCAQRESEAYQYCMERIEDLGLPMKLISVECFFDASKYVFYFTSEGRVDFRELVKQLVARFPVRIEMRQIGVRHAAKMTGGIACCGQELCCARYLTDFRPVSVKMAKTQNLSLNPAKISGGCGRLMCCLAYEHDTYEEFKKGLPKVGKEIRTPKGEGVVLKFNPLTDTVSVMLKDETVEEVSRDEIVYDSAALVQKNNGDDECHEEVAGDFSECLDDGPLPESL